MPDTAIAGADAETGYRGIAPGACDLFQDGSFQPSTIATAHSPCSPCCSASSLSAASRTDCRIAVASGPENRGWLFREVPSP